MVGWPCCLGPVVRTCVVVGVSAPRDRTVRLTAQDKRVKRGRRVLGPTFEHVLPVTWKLPTRPQLLNLSSLSNNATLYFWGPFSMCNSKAVVNKPTWNILDTYVVTLQHHCWTQCWYLTWAGSISALQTEIYLMHYSHTGGWTLCPKDYPCSFTELWEMISLGWQTWNAESRKGRKCF